VQPSKTDQIVEKLRKSGVKVVNFRKEEPTVERGGKTVVRQSTMFPGYIFLRGKTPQEILSLPFAPRLMRSEEFFRTVRASELKKLLDEFGGSLWKLGRQDRLRMNQNRQTTFLETVEGVKKALERTFRVKESFTLRV